MSKKPKKPITKKAAIAQAIAACADKRGVVRPAAVVKTARNPDSILHGEFEWRDTVLIQQALEARAAELIRQCRSMVDLGERELVFPTYVHDQRSDAKGYVATISIAKNGGLKRRAFESEIAQIGGSIKRAMALAVVWNLEGFFERALQEITNAEIAFETRTRRGDEDSSAMHA